MKKIIVIILLIFAFTTYKEEITAVAKEVTNDFKQVTNEFNQLKSENSRLQQSIDELFEIEALKNR